ncbi:MAG: hypothetical protein QOI81_1891 [Actinomycetota bacterium]|nr:hypothetical protein [Actinomycetota bacterium]
MIKDPHFQLMENDPDVASADKGDLLTKRNSVGPRQATAEESYYGPPPPGKTVRRRLFAWETWIHRLDAPIILRVAVGHYQLEMPHPFVWTAMAG